jgi:FkbM family methyltransferase
MQLLSTRARRMVRSVLPASTRDAIKRAIGLPLTRLHSDWKILGPIGPVDRPHVVLDVGAHEGWFFHCWKDWCPQAIVHAFEPQADALEKGKELYGSDPLIHFVGSAVGSTPGELNLQVMEDSRVSSSFLAPVGETWKAIDYHTGPITRRNVPVIRIDDYLRAQAIDSVFLMKIDVQGFELEVLKGAEASLPSIDYIFVESAIRPLYAGAPRFSAVFDHLDTRGFHLMAMRAWHRGNHALVECDMLFRRNDLMPAIDPAVDRVMEHI